MSKLKRINQETFDEVVRENIDDLDMSLEEAIKDAIEQFTKQGVDLSTVDLSGGIGKDEYLAVVSKLKALIDNGEVSSSSNAASIFDELSVYLDDKYEHSKRNVRLLLEHGGYRSIHSLIRVGCASELMIAALALIKKISRSNGNLDHPLSLWL
jgi:hypothetical protein